MNEPLIVSSLPWIGPRFGSGPSVSGRRLVAKQRIVARNSEQSMATGSWGLNDYARRNEKADPELRDYKFH